MKRPTHRKYTHRIRAERIVEEALISRDVTLSEARKGWLEVVQRAYSLGYASGVEKMRVRALKQ